jgi:hypothetical protein
MVAARLPLPRRIPRARRSSYQIATATLGKIGVGGLAGAGAGVGTGIGPWGSWACMMCSARPSRNQMPAGQGLRRWNSGQGASRGMGAAGLVEGGPDYTAP